MNFQVKYWLETIADDEIRESALRQCNTESSCDSIEDAIYFFRSWDVTSEDGKFWLGVYNKALEGNLKLRDYITPDGVWKFTAETREWSQCLTPEPFNLHIDNVAKAIEILKSKGYLIFEPNSNL